VGGPVRAGRLPLLGDDLKSQFGATPVHHALVDALTRNGVRLRRTSQLVSGGNMDFLNMQDPDRVATKKTSKVQGLAGVVHEIAASLMKAPPSRR